MKIRRSIRSMGTLTVISERRLLKILAAASATSLSSPATLLKRRVPRPIVIFR